MYPLCKTPVPSTSGFIPRPISTFKPVPPANSQHSADAQNTYQQQSIGSSPGSSLLCGQCTPLLLPQIQAHPHRSPYPPGLQHLNSQTPIVLIHHGMVHISPVCCRLFSNPNNNHHSKQIQVRLPSLPFQLEQHTPLCPALLNKRYPNP